LIPFLPTLVVALERHGHLQLSEETRRQLLSMSPATADRVLHTHRTSAPRGLCTTTAGPLLKEQIPIRTFQQWDATRPGFLEADLVAHCGKHTQGSYLYTLTLTDVATGWTECLPVLYKSPEVVLSAFQQSRTLFPFPILGLDVDNGGEFITALLMHYCQTEQITFTRGREDLKADQCFVEQKNGAIVRQFVGHCRLVGEQASRQLRELYRAVRLYVNCFQPSMKLLAKHREGEKVRRVYDAAKTPLHRLLLSGIVSPERQQQLRELEAALDPLRLLQQVENLQRAVWHSCVDASLLSHLAPAVAALSFCIHDCLGGMPPAQEKTPAEAVVLQPVHAEAAGSPGVLDWPRTSKDPFEGQWERILSLVLAHPEWSGSDLFQQMQRLFPGRYRPSQQRTLQLGLRKIRARLLSMQEPWPQEVIQAARPTQICVDSDVPEQKADQHAHAVHSHTAMLVVRELLEHPDAAATPIDLLAPGAETSGSQSGSVPSVVSELGDPLAAESALPQAAEQHSLRARGLALFHRAGHWVLSAGAASQWAEFQNAGVAPDRAGPIPALSGG
jgi:hypothetical protein